MKNIGNVCNFFVINDPGTLSYRFLQPSTSLLEPLFPQFQTLLYVVENLFASLTLLGRGTENRRQFVPRLPQYPGETSDVLSADCLSHLVKIRPNGTLCSPSIRINSRSILCGSSRESISTKSETIYSCICSTLPNNQITPIIFHVSPFSGIICMK